MIRSSVLPLAALVALAGGTLRPDLPLGRFSAMQPGAAIGDGWEPLRLGDARPTAYALVRDGEATVVRAQANRSASGLIKRVHVSAAEFPVLAWRWKVENVHPRGDVTRRHGDDYPARIYVTFDYPVNRLSLGDRVKYRALRALGFRDVPVRALNYIWANRAGETRIVDNPYTGWVKMVPVESGAAHVGRWREVTRDVAADYRAAFGEEPPPISGVAIMTDGDNTGGAATAYYGDVVLRAR